jgi:hypothetical protein
VAPKVILYENSEPFLDTARMMATIVSAWTFFEGALALEAP